MAIGIYKITNPEGKVYIGQSKDIRRRLQCYGWNAGTVKGQRKVRDSIDKYGFENHKCETIEECKPNVLDERERFWQDHYNVLEDGLNSKLQKTKTKPGVMCVETKKRVSASKKGTVSWNKGLKTGPSWNKGLKTGKPSHNVKAILNLYTGIFYVSIREAAKTIGMNRTTLNAKLKGQNYNNTDFIYA